MKVSKLDLRKIPATPDVLSPAIACFSAVDDATASPPPEKIASDSVLATPGSCEVLRKSSKRLAAIQRAIDAESLRLRERHPGIEIRVLPGITNVKTMEVISGCCVWDDCNKPVAIFYNSADSVPKLRCVRHSRGFRKAVGREAMRAESDRAARCPRPDKHAWGTREGADIHLNVVRSMRGGRDPSRLRVYECSCGYFHIGNAPRDSRRDGG
jgi:hypothetical protein